VPETAVGVFRATGLPGKARFILLYATGFLLARARLALLDEIRASFRCEMAR
jgi:hypothetical protein